MVFFFNHDRKIKLNSILILILFLIFFQIILGLSGGLYRFHGVFYMFYVFDVFLIYYYIQLGL
jgi:hypothetical protein